MRVGARGQWPSIEAHTNDLAVFAAEQRAAGDAEPHIVEEDQFNYIGLFPQWRRAYVSVA